MTASRRRASASSSTAAWCSTTPTRAISATGGRTDGVPRSAGEARGGVAHGRQPVRVRRRVRRMTSDSAPLQLALRRAAAPWRRWRAALAGAVGRRPGAGAHRRRRVAGAARCGIAGNHLALVGAGSVRAARRRGVVRRRHSPPRSVRDRCGPRIGRQLPAWRADDRPRARGGGNERRPSSSRRRRIAPMTCWLAAASHSPARPSGNGGGAGAPSSRRLRPCCWCWRRIRPASRWRGSGIPPKRGAPSRRRSGSPRRRRRSIAARAPSSR